MKDTNFPKANLAELYVNHRFELSFAESSQKVNVPSSYPYSLLIPYVFIMQILGIISSSTAAGCDILGTFAMVLFLSSHEVLHPGYV